MINPIVDEYNEYARKKNRITVLLGNLEVICEETAIKKIPTLSEMAIINMNLFLLEVFWLIYALIIWSRKYPR